MEKKYLIKCTSITGVKGRIMLKGEEVPESWLLNHAEHVAAGHIEEATEAVEIPGKTIESDIAGTGESVQLNNDGTEKVKKAK